MSEQQAPISTETTFDPSGTMVIALELSGKSWEVGAIAPGLSRRPRRRLRPCDMSGLLTQLERWQSETRKAGGTARRVVLTYEAGRDGFWIARYLLTRGIQVEIMHPASILVERKGRRAKTDRIDLDRLLRTFLA
jgi:transposase